MVAKKSPLVIHNDELIVTASGTPGKAEEIERWASQRSLHMERASEK